MWTLIGMGVMAMVARLLWIRLGRLESQVELLKAVINRLQTEQTEAMDPAHPSSEVESEESDAQPSLPFDAPRKPAPEPARPAETSIPPRQPVADPPANTPPPLDVGPAIRPSLPLETTREAKSEPVPPVETTEIPQLPSPQEPVDAAPRTSAEPAAPKETAPATPPASEGSSTGDMDASKPRQSGSVPTVVRSAARPVPKPPTPPTPPTPHPVMAKAKTGTKAKARPASTAFQDKARALWRKRPSLERIFGARLAVWMGGAALAMAGYFLVAYSIELGLVTPTVRMVFGGVFGLLLLVGAEAIHRRPGISNGGRIAQAMAGAGIADLYVMLYIATTVFGLLSPTVGFLGLAATTAIALALALRLGPPTAVMGLIGGFATPALAGASEPNVPVLLAYLFLVIGGLHLLIRNRGWWWLGIPATLGGFGWVGLLLTTEIAAEHSTSLGLFLVAISGLAFLSGGHRKSLPLGQVLRDARTLTPLITGGIALAQLAVVVGVADFGWLDWGLFGLLAAGCIAVGLYDENTAILPPIALIVSIGLLGLSPAQSTEQFTVVAGVAFALFAGAGYWQTWRGRRPLLWLGQAVTASLGIYGIAYVKLHDAPYDFGADPIWAGIALLLAAPAAATAYTLLKRRGDADQTDDRPALAAGGTASAFIATMIVLAVPGTLLPLAVALQAAATALIARNLRADFINWYNIAVGALFVVALVAVPTATPMDAFWRLMAFDGSTPPMAGLIDTLLVYLLPAMAMAIVARFSTLHAHRFAAGWATTLLVAIGLAVSVPGVQLPLALALQGLAVVALAARRPEDRLTLQVFPIGMLFLVALFGVPTTTPLDALWRLFAANGSEPAAAGFADTLWIYLLPAVAMAAMARLSNVAAHRSAAGWAATLLIATGIAAIVPGAQLPLAYALQGLAVVALATRLRADALNWHAIPLGMLLSISVVAVPTATPLDALWRLFAANGSEPAAASLIDTLWIYLLPAMAMAAITWLSTVPAHRIAAGWAATVLLALGLAASVPGTQLPLAYALQGLAMVALGARIRSSAPNLHAIALGILFAIALIAVPESVPLHALLHLLAPDAYVDVAVGLDAVLWIFVLPALAAVAAARLTASALQRLILAGTAAGLVTLALSAALPADWLTLAIGVEALLLALLANRREGYGLYQLSIAAVLIYLVQIVPLVFQIATGTLPSLFGTPVFAGDLPGLAEFLRRVALPAIPIATMAAWLPGERLDIVRRSVGAIGAVSALLLAYIAVKALFGIDDGVDFQARGFFERAVMTQLSFGAGALAFWLSRHERYQALKVVGLSFTAVGLGRLVWFDLVMFNPMFLAQEVGALPLLNGLLITYGMPILWLTLLGRTPGLLSGSWATASKAAILALVTILVGYQVRKFFQGSLLIGGPVGTAELYGYSVAALATGIGFLVWGTAREDRLVRLVSLALMLAAVGKVFLYDASELTGLWRIAAFAGLGFSLLGISWFYTRYVFTDQRGREDPAEAP